MSGLPTSLGFLTAVDTLNVGMSRDRERRRLSVTNCITVIPKSIVHMEQLKYLNLSGNQIQELPIEFGKLAHLSTLDMGKPKCEILFGQRPQRGR